MWSTVISRTSGQLLLLGVQGGHGDSGFEAGEVPSEYRLEAFRLVMKRLPESRRLWSKTCLTGIHLVAPERKSRHFVSEFTRSKLIGGPGWTRTNDLGLIRTSKESDRCWM